MSKKQITTTIIVIVSFIAVLLLGYYILNKQDKTTTLTLLDKQWIESNKNKVFDFSLPSNMPLFNIDGEGIVFDFLNDFSKTTKLSFNKTTYSDDADLSKVYSLKVVDKKAKSDLLVYQDHFVLLSDEEVYYNQENELSNLTIGVLEDHIDLLTESLGSDKGIKYVTYNSIDKLIASFKIDSDLILLPRVEYLENIMLKDGLNIAYHVYDITSDYVISLGDNSKLNEIVTKYFKKWYKENFATSYNKHFTANYFDFNNIDSKTKAKFRSKRYSYGLIANLPYDDVVSSSLAGINSTLLKEFAALANIEISYKKYSNVKALVEDFKSNKLDLFYNISNTHEYDMDVIKAPHIYTTTGVILVPYGNNKTITSLNNLKGVEVLTIKDTELSKTISKYATIKAYDDISELLNKKENSIIAIDYTTYQFYKNEVLNKYLPVYTFEVEDNAFNLRDISNNEVFNDYFMLYLSYTNKQNVLDRSYQALLPNNNISIVAMVFNVLGYVLFVVVLVYEIKRKFFTKGKRKETALTKVDKLKYIDMLTSLKNRNYLNDNIEKWDSRDIYPQAIIMLDLNNIAYINDNYGYQEGDKVIVEAANILINNQIENSDIIRTNGNEFLVYLVGYEEKQVVLYMRKLNRELKEVTHGYGAAVGYSMIVDAIKTVDDAINEATMDMRTNKEDAIN